MPAQIFSWVGGERNLNCYYSPNFPNKIICMDQAQILATGTFTYSANLTALNEKM